MEIITKNIYQDILEISDISLQIKLWLNKDNSTGMISSFVELMNRLFDDNDFDAFIDNGAKRSGISSDVIYEMRKLRDLLNGYKEREDDEAIINDPKWLVIVQQAKNVISLWKVNVE
ncbi:hypothetical protein [Parapedobacter sp. DT-150]|uniref:hypothetical protein n=1 Tax=Parapedobacter sp. DT-150 TaxID=3396162 RepID=UPI003F1E33BF